VCCATVGREVAKVLRQHARAGNVGEQMRGGDLSERGGGGPELDIGFCDWVRPRDDSDDRARDRD
jgi:hypothetical protein